MPIPTVWRSEYRINTTQFATAESDVEVAALANGRFAMTWVSDDSVANDADARFTIRKADGDALSASFDDTIMAGNGARDEFRAAAAGLPDGRMVFVWDEEAVGGGEKDVYAEVRNADGGTFSDRFTITQPSGVATDDQDVPTVLGLSNGNLMVAYRDTQPATDTIRVRPYDIAGVLQGGNTISSTAATNSVLNRPQMAELANGNVVVTWSSGVLGASQQKFGIRTPSGLAVLAETDVNPEDVANESVAGDVVALADGNFVVIFTRPGDVNDVQGRLFDQDGNALGGRFDISSGIGINPAATALHDGRFMVVVDTGAGGNIFGQVMFADGTPDGGFFTIDNAGGIQGDPSIATLADGRVVVSWRSDELGTSDIFAEIHDPRETGLNAGASSFADDWIGTGFADTVFLGGGNDTLLAGAGANRAFGEAGNDTLAGEMGADSLFGGGGHDSLDGGADGDTIVGDLGNDTLTAGLGNDSALGGAGRDSIIGGDGNDTLDGGGSNDTLTGGLGDDHLLGRTGDDTLNGGDGLNSAVGGDGLDSLDGGAGIDTVSGGAGADRIIGGAGGDMLFGGSEADIFVLADPAHSQAGANQDGINDFSKAEGDRLGLTAIDAVSGTPANDVFTFIGAGPFDNVAGRLRIINNVPLGISFVQGDLDGDNTADFQVRFTGLIAFVAGDFLL